MWSVPDQKITSADTSINASQLPATFKRVEWVPGTTNADIGGGRFDNGTQYLSEKGVRNVIFDPFNRSAEHNRAAVKEIAAGGSDTATVNNVLNVIAERENRGRVIAQAADAVKSDGTAYFLVYEGDRTGNPKNTTKGWQENRKASDYVGEIETKFGNVKVSGNLITARNPKK
jgi:hypothetical protein